jgi:hypothetical protein
MQSRQAKTHSPDPTKKTAEPIQIAVSSHAASKSMPAWTSAWGDQPPAGLFPQEVDIIPNLQAKLEISQPDDPYEQEADHVAEQVMRMPDSAAPVQRKCACGGIAGPAGECEACARKRQVLQRRATDQATTITGSPTVDEALRSPGQPLDSSTKAFMEPRFGYDFSSVQVHTDDSAAKSAQSLNALAYTRGNDIFFGPNQFVPHSLSGQRLLAHELTHTIQQQGEAPHLPKTSILHLSRKISDVPAIQLRAKPHSGKATGKQASKGNDSSDTLSIRWRGSVRSSLFEYIKHLHQSDENAAEITTSLLNSTRGFQSGQKMVSLEEFESHMATSGATTFELDENLTAQLMKAVGMDRRQLQITEEVAEALAPLEGAIAQSQMGSMAPEKKTEKSKRWQPAEPTHGNWQVLEGNKQLALFYLQLMEHFAGLKVTDTTRGSAEGGLTKEELDKLINKNRVLEHYTNLFTQGYQEFLETRDTNLDHFKHLEERIFEQFTFGNPTATQNMLRIGEGWPERGQIGIVHRSSGMLLYNSNGDPLASFGGSQMRDPGYSGTPQNDSFGINIALIEDPAIFQILNSLRQQLGDPTRTVLRAAEVYFNNMEEVNKRVLKGLTDEVINKFEEALPIFLGFLAGHGLSTFLMRAPNPVMVSVGLALKGLLTAAGYILNIQFAGSALQRLLEAAYHISRLQQVEGQHQLTALSEYHLEEGAKPIRSMVADIAVMATMFGLNKLIGAINGKDSATIECTECDIEEGRAKGSKAKSGEGEASERSKVKSGKEEGTESESEPEKGAAKKRAFPDYVFEYIEALKERYPRLRQSKLRPKKRGTGPGMFEERMRTGSGENSFLANLRDGRTVEIDDIGPDGSIHDTKTRSGTVEDFPETKNPGKIRDLEIQMEKQSEFIKENGLPEGTWETNNSEFADLLGEIRIRLKIKNISIVLRK